MSFAPIVITTGMLMVYEAVALPVGNTTGADCAGWFFNPYRPRVENPLPRAVAALARPIVRRALNRMMGA